MPVPRNASYDRNPRLYAPLSQSEAERHARDLIDAGCAAVVRSEQCAIVIRRDGQEVQIGLGWSWTDALDAAIRSRRQSSRPDPDR